MLNNNLYDYMFLEQLKLDFSKLEKITDRWGFIRQAYMEMIPYIIEKAKSNLSVFIFPYFIDWITVFTPIEKIAWNSIRTIGSIPLYPQFPLFNFFIDFANPYLRIGLELDGKEFHDIEKDQFRDQKLYEYGWKIFRVNGSECYTKYKILEEIEQIDNDDEKEIELRNWLFNTCDGVLFALREVYFTSIENRNQELINLALQTLNKHRIAEFSIEKNDFELH